MEQKKRCALLVAGGCASEVESSSVDVFAGAKGVYLRQGVSWCEVEGYGLK